MRWHSRIFLSGILLMLLPGIGRGQSDLCVRSLPNVPNEARAEQLRIEAAERTAREAERRGWEVKNFPVKNITNTNNPLSALCILRVEVVFQPQLRIVQIRAPKELMAEVEDAIKRLDVPPPPPEPPRVPVMKDVELTAFVIVAVDSPDPQRQPIPDSLQSVANQLKSVLPNGALYLADTVVGRGKDQSSIRVGGNTEFYSTQISIMNSNGVPYSSFGNPSGGPLVIRLNSLQASTKDVRGDTIATFSTNLDVPVGSQVVLGRVTPSKPGLVRAVMIVISGKVLD
jgi:hypothetical protein